MTRFIREVRIPLLYDRIGVETTVEIAVTDPSAYVEKVTFINVGEAREVIVYVRDKGDWAEAGCYVGIDFVMRTSTKTPIPALSGRFLGCIPSRCGRWQWYLFARKTGDPPKKALFVPARHTTEQESLSPDVSLESTAPSFCPKAAPAPGKSPTGKPVS